MVRNIRLDHLSVCRFDRKVYCGKTAGRSGCRLGGEWGRSRMGVLDGVVIVKGNGQFRGLMERPNSLEKAAKCLFLSQLDDTPLLQLKDGTDRMCLPL